MDQELTEALTYIQFMSEDAIANLYDALGPPMYLMPRLREEGVERDQELAVLKVAAQLSGFPCPAVTLGLEATLLLSRVATSAWRGS